MKKHLSFLTKSNFMTNIEDSASRASRFENFIFEGEVVGDMSLDPPWQLAHSAIAVLALMSTSELATPLSFLFPRN